MRRRVASVLLVCAGVLIPPRFVLAQGPCGAPASPSTEASASTPAAWPAPLDRRVSLRLRDVSLREALDRLSAAAHVQASYSSDLLPLGNRVCVLARDEALGSVLARLLAGTGVEPSVVAGQVVLGPARAGATPPTGTPITERDNPLDAIVATGSPEGMPRRPLTVGVTVIDGARLSRRWAESLPDVLNAAVPGVWAWRQSPSSLTAQYGSVRGASSFLATYPKVYVDGVEAANPLLITEIDPDDVERVEVIRGPQGAALYGSDAISGVINIVTRHQDADGAGARTQLRSIAGLASSAYAPDRPSTWEHRLALETGSNVGSAGLSLTVARTGAIFPGADSRRISAVASARRVERSAVLNASFRFSDRRAGVGQNPLLDTTLTSPFADTSASDRQSVRLYTLATSAVVATQGPWTHTVLVGLDGYRLNYVPDSFLPFPNAAETLLRSAQGGGDRGTLRASSTLRLGGGGDVDGTFTVALEHSVLRQKTLSDGYWSTVPQPMQPARQRQRAPEEMQPVPMERWRHDSGVLAQASGGWRNTLFGTAGLRLERSDAFAGDAEISALPMLGAAWVRHVGAAEVKLRTAFGRGIRPASSPAREHLRPRERFEAPDLAPEEQTGIEVGGELYAGGLSLQATRFDQRASGLIQDVALGVDTFTMRDGRQGVRVDYALQNVGAIDNRGWEMQGGWSAGPLSLTGTLALVDSRVRRLAIGYVGELRPGDRMLAVPARTASLGAEWEGRGWTGAVTATRAWSWTNYDRVALATFLAADSTPGPRGLEGGTLRSFWRRYDGATDLRATFSRQVRGGVWLVARGENLLGGQVGEPDNLTIRAGRSISLGARAEF